MDRATRQSADPSPRELAANLREGRQIRRIMPALPPLPVDPVYVDVHGPMLGVAGVLGHPAPPAGGLRKIKRYIQRLMKKMLNPWWDLQTRFNHETTDTLSKVHIRTHEHGHRLNELLTYINQDPGIHSRLNDCFYNQQQQGLRLGREIDQLHVTAEEQRHRLDALTEQSQSDRSMGDTLSAGIAELKQALQTQTAANEERFQQLWEALHQTAASIEQLRDTVDQVRDEVHARPTPTPMGPPIKDIINRELRSEGKIAEAGLYFNPPITVEYDPERPQVAMVTERILEGIFVHSRLPMTPVKLLDLGCAESINAIEMASLGHKVTGVDLRSLPVPHPNFKMVIADLCNLPFDDETFDCAVALSTLEHVGLAWYTDEPSENSDFKAIQEAARVMKPGARFITTLPFGREAGETRVHRIYDQERLEKLLEPLKVSEISYGIRDGETWHFTHDAQRASSVDSIKRVSAVALVVAEKE